MKKLFIFSVLVVILTAAFSTAFAEIQQKYFSTEGTLTDVQPEQKTLRLKNKGGLELTFRAEEGVAVRIGGVVKSFADLHPGDSVEMEYDYNENYEKILQSISVTPAG